MKKFLLFLFINLVSSVPILHAHNAVKIIDSDGNETIFLLENENYYVTMELLIKDPELIVHTAKTTVKYIIDPNIKFEFLDYDAGIETLENSDIVFNISPNFIEGRNLQSNSWIYIFGLNGNFLKKAKVSNSGNLKIDISDIPEGVLIVKYNNKSFKFFKK